MQSSRIAVLTAPSYLHDMNKPTPTLQIRNQRVADLAAKLATIRKSSKTDAVREALENELARIESAKPLAERLKALQDRVASRPATGLEADKAFYDDISGDL